MQVTDLTVEVRDKSLARLGQIRPEDLRLELEDVFCNIGKWVLKLASEHPLAGPLRQPGAGIIVIGPDGTEMFSGPMTNPDRAVTADDPAGTVAIEGVSDTVILADALAFPQPGNPDPETQTLAHDTRTGARETLMHAYVNANIGPGAPAERRKANLTMGADLGRGGTVTKSARFPVLGNLVVELATVADLGFRVIQRGSGLVFETYAVTDRTAEIRLDVYNNTLAGHRVMMSPPGATQVIVAGQGELVKRKFVHLNTTASVAAEADWGRRIERFVDQRQAETVAELTQAGNEVLAEEGDTLTSIQVVPMDDSAMPFGTAWGLGDKVAVVIDGEELYQVVTGYVLRADEDGCRIGARLGERTISSGSDDDLGQRMTATERRVSALERTAESTNYAPEIDALDTQLQSVDSRTADLEAVQGDYARTVDIEGNLVRQFATAGDRDTEIPSPAEGMLSYLASTQGYEAFDGTDWVQVAGGESYGAWATYTPSWQATTTAPSVGNGTLAGMYRRVGKTGFAVINLTFGSTTNAGSGNYKFGLPPGWTFTNGAINGVGLLRDNSSAVHWTCGCTGDGTYVDLRVQGANVGSSTSPTTWAANDFIRLMIWGELL